MPYTKTDWKDRVVEKPLTYTMQQNADGTITLIPAEGAIIETGTPINAAVMDNLETQYEQAMADALPKAGGALIGPLTSNSDITTTADINALDGNFTGNLNAANLIVTGDVTATEINMVSSGGDVRNVMTTKDDGDAGANNGFGVAIGAGGTLIIGGGESPQNILVSTLVPTAGTERMLLTSDNDIQVMTGMQNVATDPTIGKRFTFATNGDFGLGGDNVDNALCILSYDKPLKTLKLIHWTGAATQYDTVLMVGDIDYQQTPINLPLTSPAVEYSTGTNPVYIRKGGNVTVWGAIKGLTAISVSVATLPVGFRPSRAVSFGLPTSGKNFARWTIGTDGRIVLENVSQTAAPTATDWFPLNFTFPIE